MKTYAGIGSRDTPLAIQHIMFQIAKHLAANGYTLRSGGAQGADQAFEKGCDSINGNKEIYLPWANFENSKSTLVVKEGKAYDVAEQYHPYWHNLSQGARKLQARNSHQVLGVDLSTPCSLLICYTKAGKKAGGTGQALRIAEAYGVPIFDCGAYEKDLEELKSRYRDFLKSLYI